jgi:hypothetical protein
MPRGRETPFAATNVQIALRRRSAFLRNGRPARHTLARKFAEFAT